MKLKCEICQKQFENKSHRRTCSKICKNKLARRQSTDYFKNPKNREKTSQATKEGMKSVDMKTISSRENRNYQGENHPRFGKEVTKSQRDKASASMKGKTLGLTYEEMYGVEKAADLRNQRSEKMAETNASLMSAAFSKAELGISPILAPLGFEHSQKIGKFTVDFLNRDKFLIVEFYGDYWHANPSSERVQSLLANGGNHPSLKKPIEEIWFDDAQRKHSLERRGFEVFVIWESDWQADSATIVKTIESKISNLNIDKNR